VDPVVECLWIGIPLPLIKDGFFALHHLFIKSKVAIGIFAFSHILKKLFSGFAISHAQGSEVFTHL
jgi:hypothetical protein